MTSTQTDPAAPAADRTAAVDMALEVVVVPVSDVEAAKRFYAGLGWRLDVDYTTDQQLRVVQLTPPGSGTSIIFGAGITAATPGSIQDLQLVVTDLDAARADLIGRGVAVSEVFHDRGGVFHHGGTEGRVAGPDPQGRSYGSFASFDDPDGNGWVLQQVTTRLPGRTSPAATAFATAQDLEAALRRAAVAHGAHEQRIGRADPEWPVWYARYMVADRAGTQLPV